MFACVCMKSVLYIVYVCMHVLYTISELNIIILSLYSFIPLLTLIYRGNDMHCTDCLRLTVGTREENDKFLALFVLVATELGVGQK